MRIKLQSPIVISCDTKIGQFLTKQCVFAFHALTISLFIYIVAVNKDRLESSLQPIRQPIYMTAKYLEYPVFYLGYPLVMNSSYESKLWLVPSEFGMRERYQVLFSSASSDFEYTHGRVRIFDTWLFTPGFNSHMQLSFVVYLLLFNLLSWLYRIILNIRLNRKVIEPSSP